MHHFEINILIFNFRCLLHVSNPRVRLQDDGCIYRYGVVCFTGIGFKQSCTEKSVFIHTLLCTQHKTLPTEHTPLPT
jgi:hypothetical protein